MATIVNNPGGSDSGAAGWMVAAIIIVAVILIGLFVWPGYARNMGAGGGESTNINVTLPDVTGGGGEGGGGAGGAPQ